MRTFAIILAAGEGKRMKTATPKVLHKLLGVEMIRYVLRALTMVNEKPIVVIGHGADEVKAALGEDVRYALQESRLGTGHAVMMAREYLQGQDGYVFVLAADMPLITEQTLQSLLDTTIESGASATVLTAKMDDPTGYGRIICDEYDSIYKIVEHKDATKEQCLIKEINASVYCFEINALLSCLDRIKPNNAQSEYYLTDVIGLLNTDEKTVKALCVSASECLGVNDLVQLANVQKVLQQRINQEHMLRGVQIIDPDTTFISPGASIGPGTIIYPSNIIEGNAQIGKNAILYPNNYIEGAQVGEGTKIGPSAHLRAGTATGKNCRVGNFVELKNVTLDDGAKVSHLAYCGDGSIGKKSNISCGVIFSNYDGNRKSRTIVGDNCFIGCNVNLVAPVDIGDGAYVAAGSTITENVPNDALGIARERQTVKPGWAKNRKRS